MLDGQGLGLLGPHAESLRCGFSPFDRAQSGLQTFGQSQTGITLNTFNPLFDATVGADSEAECALGHAPQPVMKLMLSKLLLHWRDAVTAPPQGLPANEQ